MGNKYNKWDEEKTKLFIELYPTKDKFEMAKIFNIKPSSIMGKACILGVKKERINGLDDMQKEFVRENYGRMNAKQIADLLQVDSDSVLNFAHRSKINGNFKNYWSEEEDDILKQEYHRQTNTYIHENLLPDRPISMIVNHAVMVLGLRKDTPVPKKYNPEDVKCKLKCVCDELGRAPLLRELAQFGLPSEKTFHRYIGDYHKICASFGYGNNINMFGKSYSVASNGGTPCASRSEKIVTDFLEENNISFTKENLYSEFIDDKRCGQKRFDWVINNGETFVEYFGMYDKPSYKSRADFKIALCKEHGVNLLCLYEIDLKNLHEIFNINP